MPNYSLGKAGGFIFSKLSKRSLRMSMKIKRPYE